MVAGHWTLRGEAASNSEGSCELPRTFLERSGDRRQPEGLHEPYRALLSRYLIEIIRGYGITYIYIYIYM